jgi:hypothetical protein
MTGLTLLLLPPSQKMSAIYILSDANGDAFHLQSHYIRHKNRILDANFIANISVKKNKILFNTFKQNITLPSLTVPFKTYEEACQVMDYCMNLYALSMTNVLYNEEDTKDEAFIADAFGGSIQVTPEFLRYRDRIVGVSDIRTVHVKGRRVLVNHFNGNMSAPTMCVHFEDKAAARAALNTIHSILWNVEEQKNEEEELSDPTTSDKDGRIERAMGLLDTPVDPAFIMFMVVSISLIFVLGVVQILVANKDSEYDYEL